jgi:hypothetical protein
MYVCGDLENGNVGEAELVWGLDQTKALLSHVQQQLLHIQGVQVSRLLQL